MIYSEDLFKLSSAVSRSIGDLWLLSGGELAGMTEDGMDLEAEGYQGLLLKQNDKGANVLYGQAWIDVNKDNMGDYDF